MIPGLWLPMAGFSFRTDRQFFGSAVLTRSAVARHVESHRCVDATSHATLPDGLSGPVSATSFRLLAIFNEVGGFRTWMEMGKPQLAGGCVIYEHGWFMGTSILGNLYFSHFQAFSRFCCQDPDPFQHFVLFSPCERPATFPQDSIFDSLHRWNRMDVSVLQKPDHPVYSPWAMLQTGVGQD